MEKVESQNPVVRTGRGIHVWLQSDKPVRSFKVEGLVDVKADGGYCLVPPSIHPSGKQYEFVNARRAPTLITDIEKAVWENAEKLGFKKKRFSEIQAPAALDGSSVAPNCISTLSQGAREGGRNDAAIHLASYWLNIRRLSKEYAFQWLTEWNLKNEPPLEQNELRQILESASTGGYTYRCCLGAKILRPQKLDELGLAEDVLGTKAHEAAELVMETYRILTLDDEILLYQEGIYQTGAERTIGKLVEEKFHDLGLDDISNNHFHNEVLGRIKRRTSVARDVFDKEPFILVLKNGILDLRNFQLSPHTPEYPSLVLLPVEYDAKADCPQIKKFLGEILYAEDKDPLQEFVGAILRKSPLQKALLLVGDGSNGKTTFINLVKSLLGLDNISATSMQEFEYNRFAKADLFGKMANLHADLPDAALKSVGVFKMITGGDPITAERKFQPRFNFIPYAKNIFACNKVPEVHEDTTAFFRRWLIITFPNTFSGDTEDRKLLAKLTTAGELSGFLNWAIHGLQRLEKQHEEFSYSKTVEDVREDYIRKSSPIKAFVMDCCLLDSQFHEVKKQLFLRFVEYCREKKLPPVTDTTFYKNLPLAATVTDSQHTIDGKKGVHCFEGIALKRDKAESGQESLKS